jgi:competence protein ComEC
MPVEFKQCLQLRFHVVDVAHGDAILMEMPDYNNKAHLAIIDAGRPEIAYRSRLPDYLDALINVRELHEDDYRIDFVCITHPHEDHYGGLKSLLDRDTGHIRQFWDCGFRTTATTYNNILSRIAKTDSITYMRIASGLEVEFGNTRVIALAPSLDLRNRFDTYGVDRNNATIVLQVRYKRSIATLTGDAFFDSWGKIAEEFPRMSRITYHADASPQRDDGINQLNCQLLKVSHHGSKHGTSLEYLEKLTPKHFMITCADEDWYTDHKPGWGVEWPHPMTQQAIEEVQPDPVIRTSAGDGNVIYFLNGTNNIKVAEFKAVPGEHDFEQKLAQKLAL